MGKNKRFKKVRRAFEQEISRLEGFKANRALTPKEEIRLFELKRDSRDFQIYTVLH